MNENEAKLSATLADITAAHQKLISVHATLNDDMQDMKAAIKNMSNDLSVSANAMVDLSYQSVQTSLNLHRLLMASSEALSADLPSVADIETAKLAAIEAAQSVAVAANMVADAAHHVFAYIHLSQPPGAVKTIGPPA